MPLRSRRVAFYLLWEVSCINTRDESCAKVMGQTSVCLTKHVRYRLSPKVLGKPDAPEQVFRSPGNEFSPLAHLFSWQVAYTVVKRLPNGLRELSDAFKLPIIKKIRGKTRVRANHPKTTRWLANCT
jgi:hypothetical protein